MSECLHLFSTISSQCLNENDMSVWKEQTPTITVITLVHGKTNCHCRLNLCVNHQQVQIGGRRCRDSTRGANSCVGEAMFWWSSERGERERESVTMEDGGGTDGNSWENLPSELRWGADGWAGHKSPTIYKSSKTNQKRTSPKSKCRTNLFLSVRSRKTKACVYAADKHRQTRSHR